MDIRYKLYPYPVLSSFSNDYIDCTFQAEVEAIKDIGDIVFKMNIIMDNAELECFINQNKIEYLFHIECSQTSYRTIVKSSDVMNIKRIPEAKLNGKVSVCTFMVAKEDILNYSNHKLNTDYEDMTFYIAKGSILGIGGQTNIEITKEMEHLAKIPSIFSILRKDTEDNEGMQIELLPDKIKVWLPNEDFYNYRNISTRPTFIPIVHSMIIMPVLIYAFEMIKQNGADEYESYRWFKSIEKKLSRWKMDFKNELLEKPSYELAQKLLDLPIKRALFSMANIGEGEEET